ncbi:hypothetical protein NFC80_13645 [Bacillus halotolerans]|uniref:hypothetical protein n=1 Tax=Bacillus subtilis group TaxID=653685 RepID=UPI002155E361|nr:MULTISPECIES: hypothetical protein [Bacillus subtilis group]MCR6597663.1 hypothetical protein [Bacillus halotolerans]MCY8919139.1 hypothetical protein [Bacillus atrophaeus]
MSKENDAYYQYSKFPCPSGGCFYGNRCVPNGTVLQYGPFRLICQHGHWVLEGPLYQDHKSKSDNIYKTPTDINKYQFWPDWPSWDDFDIKVSVNDSEFCLGVFYKGKLINEWCYTLPEECYDQNEFVLGSVLGVEIYLRWIHLCTHSVSGQLWARKGRFKTKLGEFSIDF